MQKTDDTSPHECKNIQKKMILAKKRGGKLSAEHGKHGIDEKTSVSFVSLVFVKTHLASSFHLRCSSYVNTI